MSRDPETSAASPSPTSAPSRRTILTGAAWSVPVIAAASIAPIASASGATALAFDKATYNGTACGTITGAYVTVTVNGVATAGKSVTTTLSGGYTFAGGTSTNAQVSGSDGRVNLPAINVPAGGGNAVASALESNAATVSATVSSPVAPTAFSWTSLGSQTSGWDKVPLTATPLASWSVFLDDGDLWFNNQRITSGIDAANAFTSYNNSTGEYQAVNYTKAGKAYTWVSTGTTTAWDYVPGTATPLAGFGVFLDSGVVWRNDQQLVVGVSAATALNGTNNTSGEYTAVNYTKGGKAYTWTSIGSQTNSWTYTPGTATPLQGWGSFADGGNAWYQDQNIVSGATAIASLSARNNTSGEYVAFNYMKGGKAYTWTSLGSQENTWGSVPSTAQPLRAWGQFKDGGDIWSADSRIITGVTTATAYTARNNASGEYSTVNYVKTAC